MTKRKGLFEMFRDELTLAPKAKARKEEPTKAKTVWVREARYRGVPIEMEAVWRKKKR